MPNAPECQPLVEQVDALAVQEKAKRDAIAGLAGLDKWKALQELGTIRQQLADQQALLRECETQHTSDVAIEVVVMDVAKVSGPNRMARLWQLTSAGQAVKQTATVQDGVARFAALVSNVRQSFGITIEETDHPTVNGPDFRSGPLPPPPADQQADPITRIEIVILEPVVIHPESLSQAVPSLPVSFSHPGGLFGTINLSMTGLSFSATNGGLSISATGTAAGIGISSPFSFSATLHVAPTFGMAPSTVLEISPQGVPTLSMPGIVGTLVSTLSGFLWPNLQTLTVQPLNTLLNKMLADHVAASLGLRALPSGAVLSIRQLEVDGNTLKLTPALAAFGTVLTDFSPRRLMPYRSCWP